MISRLRTVNDTMGKLIDQSRAKSGVAWDTVQQSDTAGQQLLLQAELFPRRPGRGRADSCGKNRAAPAVHHHPGEAGGSRPFACRGLSQSQRLDRAARGRISGPQLTRSDPF
jgi:hypothetical protein